MHTMQPLTTSSSLAWEVLIYLPAQSTIEMTKPWVWLFFLPDIIDNVIEQDGGWWEGDLNGKHGVFPGISSGTSFL